ncbi:hypothetical protein ACLOJK_027596, partial [Asimina triloba]
NGAEVAKEEALGLSVKLPSARSEVEALHVRDVDFDVNRAKLHAELEAVSGE